ncbi:Outer membrane lipoprotein carrier protein LolA [gamma proteobacterium IMCC1989]|nr:Outer membrane lipoprotein carrier protein LolA [gamma proteobacterium IMCC1989]
MFNVRRVVCGFCFCLSVFTTMANAADVDVLAEKLVQLSTFSGDFRQTLIDDQGEVLQESTGVFFLERPGYFHWETIAPFPQLLVSDLASIWLYDPDLEQVTVRPYDESVSQTPALLLSGDVSKMSASYEVVQTTDNQFSLTPKSQQELFTQLMVEFAEGQLVSMSLQDSLGQTTTFTFLNGIYNQPIPSELFQFIPPEGTDVIVGG